MTDKPATVRVQFRGIFKQESVDYYTEPMETLEEARRISNLGPRDGGSITKETIITEIVE